MSEEIEGAVFLPIDHDKLIQLESLLRRSKILVCGNYFEPNGPNLSHYISATEFRQVEIRAMFDRNLISPLVQLASGIPLRGNPKTIEAGREACAALAFCILGNIVIEPAMALYEYASVVGNEAAQREVKLFRMVDNADPSMLLDIALGVADQLPPEHLIELSLDSNITNTPQRESNFGKQLNLWKPNYLYALKAVELLREHRSNLAAAMSMLRWQADETFYSAPAALYCLAAMSHQPPKGRMLKSAKSDDPNAIRRGLRNATWDICMIQEFGRRVTSGQSIWWSLWSNDIGLRAVTTSLLLPPSETDAAALKCFFTSGWGNDGAKLVESYLAHSAAARRGSEQRGKKIQAAFARIDSDIAEIEAKLGIT